MIKIEKFKRGTIDSEVIYNDERSVVITIGDNEYNISEYNGGLEIQKHDGRIIIHPNVANEIVI